MNISIAGTQTLVNLMTAFAGETQAASRYEFFAKIATKERFIQIGNIFIKTALEERAHAKRFYRYMEGYTVGITANFSAPALGTTRENLLSTAEGENEEWSLTYPAFANIAKNEGFSEIAAVFRLIASIEKVHENRFRKLLAGIENGTTFRKKEKIRWECLKCGYIFEGEEPPETCPACLHPRGYFQVYEENF